MMVNMAMSKEETAEYAKAPVSLSDSVDAPKYPYGLSIDLDDALLEKLGIQQMPVVGGAMLMQAQVTITRVSSEQMQGGDAETRVCLQITDMELSAPGRDLAKSLYPDNA